MTTERFPTSFASVIVEIHRRHEIMGSRVVGGFSPHVAPVSHSLGNFISRDGVVLSSSGSIADSEMAVVHGICEIQNPRRILVIGNSYGLSTLFLALSNPDAKVVAIDKFRTAGLDYTRQLCHGLNVSAIQASTPDDLESVIESELSGQVDFVFVDAVHENDVQTREFEILEPLLTEWGLVLFHDVLGCNLLDSLAHLTHKYPDEFFTLLSKTLSGLAIGAKNVDPKLKMYLQYFSSDQATVFGLETLLATQWGEQKIGFFEGLSSHKALTFPPHPQL